MPVPAPISTPEELHDMVAGFHLEWYRLRGPEAQLGFMLLVLKDGEVGVVPLEPIQRGLALTDRRFSTLSERDLTYAAARAAVKLLGPDAYCACSEAWMGKEAKPSEDPERVEVVATVAVGRLGGQRSSVLRMERDGTGQVVALEPEPMDMAFGDMFTLFGAPTRH